MRDDEERKAAERAHGARIAAHAAEVWNWTSPAGRRRADRRADLLAQGIARRSLVLEIGAGTGELTRRLAERGLRIVATDLSIDLLRQIPMGAGGARHRVLADAERLPFRTGVFGGVVGSSILHHLDLSRAASEVLRVLSRGAPFRFAEPNMANPQIAVQKNVTWIKRALGDTPDETAFFRWPLARLLARAGATNIRVVPYDFLHPATPPSLLSAVERIGRILERIPLLREFAGSLEIRGTKA
jgi:SAM-dependent methyltransferase